MPFIPAKSVQSGGFTSASDAILNSQNKVSTPTASNFGGVFNPQSDSTLGQIDKTLSSGTGVIGGAASGVYTAAKGLVTLGKDVAVDSFNAVNHPLDSIGKAYDFAKNEAVNQGKGNENTDTVGKLVQSTVGSKGFMGVGQQIANYANDKLGRSDKSFSGGKLTGDVINSVLTLATAGGGAVTTNSLKFAAEEALQNGIINQTAHDFLLKQAAGIVGKYLVGGTVGAGFQAASNLQEGAPVAENLDKAFYAGGGVPVVAQGVSSTLSGAKTLKNKITGNSAVTSDNIDTLAGTITQGKKADIATAKKALANIDVSKVNTYEDLASVLNNKINETRTTLDSHLLTNTERKPLDQLTFTHKVGDAEIAHNYVQDSLNQLEAHYKAINEQVGVEKIAQLTEKAQKEGLTAKEVNDLARVHGQELNAFNANGQAASGLSKQAAENTRTGLKETAKSIFKDELFNTADKEMTNLIRTRDLVKGVSEKVNQLKQRIQERSLGAKVGVALGKAINLLSLGTAKGIVEALIPRGQGFKVMNALDLESTLKGNLEKLQKAMEGKTEAEILNNLNSIQDSKDLATSKNTTNITKNIIPTQSTPTVPKSKGVNYERAKGLSPENTAIETKAFNKITSNEAELLAEYKKIHGKEINTDNFRPLFKDEGYNGANAAAVQEPSSYLAKLAFADALTNDGKFAMFSAGGSGVGKSFGIKSIPELSKLKDQAAVIFDSNLSSYDSAIKKIQQAKQAGKQFAGVYTYRDPINALVNGIVKRMKENTAEMGRIVPTKVIAQNHIDSLNVVKRLMSEGYDFRIVDNSKEGAMAKLTNIKDIESKAKYPSVKELTDIMNKKIKELYDRGELTPEQYKEYVN